MANANESRAGTASAPDESFMRQAIVLARRGLGMVSPNPMVGAVIAEGDTVFATGYHRYFGGPHAEAVALARAGEGTRGATLYVTLEPCSHHGKTPPCAEAVVNSGITRVVIGTLDPNPLVNGDGVRFLREHGVQTTVGVLEAECRALNQAHFKLMETGIPLITLKFAQTLDGRIAAANGVSRWISSEQSRRHAHRLRVRHDAVLVGVGTVLADDPELNVRLVKGRSPLRVVLDSQLRTPVGSKILAPGAAPRTLLLTTDRVDCGRREELSSTGAEVMVLPADTRGQVDIIQAMRLLGERQVSSLLVEGGAGVITSFLRGRLADRLVAFIAPKIMGEGIAAVGDLGVTEPAGAVGLSIEKVRRLGGDVVIEAALKYS